MTRLDLFGEEDTWNATCRSRAVVASRHAHLAVVGEIADDLAVLTSETLQLFRMPLALLPHPLTVGMIVDLHAAVKKTASGIKKKPDAAVMHGVVASS